MWIHQKAAAQGYELRHGWEVANDSDGEVYTILATAKQARALARKLNKEATNAR